MRQAWGYVLRTTEQHTTRQCFLDPARGGILHHFVAVSFFNHHPQALAGLVALPGPAIAAVDFRPPLCPLGLTLRVSKEANGSLGLSEDRFEPVRTCGSLEGGTGCSTPDHAMASALQFVCMPDTGSGRSRDPDLGKCTSDPALGHFLFGALIQAWPIDTHVHCTRYCCSCAYRLACGKAGRRADWSAAGA